MLKYILKLTTLIQILKNSKIPIHYDNLYIMKYIEERICWRNISEENNDSDSIIHSYLHNAIM